MNAITNPFLHTETKEIVFGKINTEIENSLIEDFNNPQFLSKSTNVLTQNLFNYLKNKQQFLSDFEKMFFLNIIEKSLSKHETLKLLKNEIIEINTYKEICLEILKSKNNKLKEIYKNKEITKDKYLEFKKIDDYDKKHLNEIYKKFNQKSLLKEIDLEINNFLNYAKERFFVNLEDLYSYNYYLLSSRIFDVLNKNKGRYQEKGEYGFNDFDPNLDFFTNCSKYYVIYDGEKTLSFKELLDLLCSKELLLSDKYKDNVFIGFYLTYFSGILKANKNFEDNLNLYSVKFKDTLNNYYKFDLHSKIKDRISFWSDSLNFYNNKVDESGDQVETMTYLHCLIKENIFEFNRLISLINKINVNPLNVKMI